MRKSKKTPPPPDVPTSVLFSDILAVGYVVWRSLGLSEYWLEQYRAGKKKAKHRASKP